MSRKPRTGSSPDDKSDTARRIWLAGLGAYGRAFSEAQGTLARAAGETSKIFDDLVEKGERIESAVETKGRELARKVTTGAPLDERIRRMRARLGLDDEAPAPAAPAAIEARLAAVEDKLDRVLAALEARSAKPAAKRRSPSRKAKPKPS